MPEERAAKQPDHHAPEPQAPRTPAPALDQDAAGGVSAAVGVAVGTAPPSDPGSYGRHRAVLQRLPSDPLRREFVLTLSRQYGNIYVQRVLAPDRAAAGTGNGEADGGPRIALARRTMQPIGRPTIERIGAPPVEDAAQRQSIADLAHIGLAPPVPEAEGAERARLHRSSDVTVQRLSLTDGFASIVEQVSPGLADLIRRGPLSLLLDKIKAGIQSWLRGVLGAVNIGPIIGALQSSITGAFSTVMGVLTGDPAACASFAGTIEALRALGQAFMDNPAVQQLQAAFSTVKGVFQKVNELVVAPALDALMSIAGGIFDQVKALASTIWGWAGDVRDYLGAAWDWVKEQLGLGGDGEEGILDWLKSKAAAAWTQIKETLAPVIGPLKTVVGMLLVFSPVGPTILIVKYVPPLVEAVQWLWAHRSDPNIVQSAHQQMGHTILPKLLSTVQGFGQAVKGAATEIVNKAVEIGEGVLSLLGAISGVPLLNMARGLVETVSNGLQQLVSWGRETLQAAADAIVDLFQKIKAKVEPYIEVLSSLAMAVVNPAAIPIILAGWAWRKLDDCYKEPIIDFLLGIVIRLLRAAPNLPMMGPLWPLLKTGVIAFVEGVRNKDDPTKIALTNKFAKIMSGASPAFILGFVKGFLIGIWEGLTDPFVLIYNLLKGLNSVQTWLTDAATQALAPTPAPATAGAAAGAAGPAPASNRLALAQRMRQMAGELEPPVQTVTTGFMPALEEVFSGGKGMSFSDLMAKLGQAWAAVEAKIREVGGELADKACQYFLRDAADGEIGEGVGWLAGTITFEVVLAILTAGTYEVLKPLQGIAKVLDWTGEAFGILFKWLGKVGGWVMDGLRGLRRLLANAGGSVRVVLDAIGEFGQKLLRYADELMGRVGREAAGEAGERGGRKAAGEAAEEGAEAGGKRAGGELGEEGAEQGGRRADDADGVIEVTPEGERIVAKEPTVDGQHEIKVTEQGDVLLCSSCDLMRKEYAAELKDPANRQLADDLDAADQIADPVQKAEAEKAIEQRLKAARQARHDALAVDPQALRPLPKSISERDAMLLAEGDGFAQNARRPNLKAGEPNLDFKVDGGWVDIKTPDTRFRTLQENIADVADKSKLYDPDVKVVIDLKNLSPADKLTFMNELPKQGVDMSRIHFVNK